MHSHSLHLITIETTDFIFNTIDWDQSTWPARRKVDWSTPQSVRTLSVDRPLFRALFWHVHQHQHWDFLFIHSFSYSVGHQLQTEEPFQWNGVYDCHFGIVLACCYLLRTWQILWANLSFTLDNTSNSDMGWLSHGFPTSPSLKTWVTFAIFHTLANVLDLLRNLLFISDVIICNIAGKLSLSILVHCAFGVTL